MEQLRYRNYLKMLLVALLCLILSGLFYMFREREINVERHVQEFQEAFLQKDENLQHALEDFQRVHGQKKDSVLLDQDFLTGVEGHFRETGQVFMMARNDSLVFWSHNAIPIFENELPEDSKGLLHLQNGWYFFRQAEEGNLSHYVFMAVMTSFRYENRFLINRFVGGLDLPASLFFLSAKPEEGFAVTDKDGDYAFSLVLRRETGLTEVAPFFHLASMLMAVAGLLILIFINFRFFTRLFRSGKETMAIGGFAAVMIVLRLISFWQGIPSVFYAGELFSPALYATSSVLPSLGDLFLNVLFFSIISFFLYTNLKKISIQATGGKPWRSALGASLFGIIYIFCSLAVSLIHGLVFNSSLNLDVNFIFNLDVYSLVGFLIIGCIFFSFFFLSVVLFRLAFTLIGDKWRFWGLYLGSFLVFGIWHGAIWGPAPLHWVLFFISILVFEMERKSESPQANFTALVVSLFLFSMVSTFALYQFNREKDLEKRKTLALQLSSEQDPVAEFLFLEMEEALFNDNQLRNLVRMDPGNTNAVYRYLQHHYFYDFWAKYDLQITICQPGDPLLIIPSNIEVECSWFFGDYIDSFGKPTISDQLIYLDNNTGRNSYITQVPVPVRVEEEETLYNIYIEFDSKFIARDLGFPELLIDDRVDLNRDLINFSHATYKDGRLINKFGPFNYSNELSVYGTFQSEFTPFSLDDFRHLVFRKDDNTEIIISRPRETMLERIAPFSYLFVLFFILIAVFWMMTSDRPASDLLRLNFKRRVQVSMISIVVASVLAIGGASTWFILNISQDKNLAFLNEKAHSVVSEMEFSLSMANVYALDHTLEPFLSDMLLRQLNIFYTDVNLYDTSGRLLASSRPKLFEEGLVSTRMNPLALAKLRDQRRNQYIHTEQIGKLEYLSAYIPLTNHYQELMGYINLPYFAKEGELRNELSYFLVAFINIYLLLLVLAILLALFISNFVTQPLHLIRENLSRVQLGKANQKIEWPRNDEIGSLVKEYNRMIDELDASAELLARSERESAWREMAKQVAHEIKNPLTPMRLSIQYLEKAWKENAPDWDARLERFSRTMVEQIDNLSVIAGAFSDFAKMPSGNNNHIDLRKFIPEILDLYKDVEKLAVNPDLPEGKEPLWVSADKNQLIRVFNNLINNAIQAYPKNQTPRIDIECSRIGDHFRIDVKDYGCGIPDELKKHIFSPNFTTKTSGTGLGLSMVKSIVEHLGGSVSFHSEEGQGSIFSFRLPVLDTGNFPSTSSEARML
jgi:two-component system, NtrC family, nitrogen regulation sensor histidine kinase NtrY